ncbi:MAG TPA: NUDIX domain-containing protein [Candidatus Saccharimonadales bacterium]|nr:NUDIX domain-containing protein [Candidatus Saccharimonadales bacterium]
MADQPLAQIVDENDNPIGAKSVPEIRNKGLLHRLARVMVEDSNGNILLQKRIKNAVVYPGRWDNSAAGHVDDGETYEQAAIREAAEEIGLLNVSLTEIGYLRHTAKDNGRVTSRFVKFFRTVVSSDTKFEVQPEEVDEVEWFKIDDAKKLAAEHPEQMTDGLIYALKHYF